MKSITSSLLDNANYPEVVERIVGFIRSFAKDKKIVMGLSGGIDSSVSCALAVRALGADSVKVVIVHNSQFTKEGIEVARTYASNLGVSVQEVGSEGLRESIVQSLGIDKLDLILKATIDVRICDLIIRTVAQVDNRLYMGTINGTERLVGWFPKGALVGDFCPISGLFKHQLIEIAKFLNLDELAEGVSQDASIVCGGCGELPEFKGISYQTLDKALYIYETILTRLLTDNGVAEKEWEIIFERIKNVAHKKDLFPKFCKINY